MELLARHVILVSAETAGNAKTRIRQFFDRTSLVRYDRIDFVGMPLSAQDNAFTLMLKQGLDENHRILDRFIEELGNTGLSPQCDLAEIPQGYQSKILHIIAHFLDGFIGVDSAFYNLIDDSHWLTDETAHAVTESPERYWLCSLDGYSTTPKEAVLLHT